MKYPNKDYIEHLRRKYPPGTRLQLSCMEDEFPVPPGSMGTVECIDDAGQIHVDWDYLYLTANNLHLYIHSIHPDICKLLHY